jgi:hypothetical protein
MPRKILMIMALAFTGPAATLAQDAATMEAWVAYATPGPAHATQAALEGTWDARSRVWSGPGAPPLDSSGVSENRMILGGRFLEQRFRGEMMGRPFEGFGITGYDNYKKKYLSTWADNFGTTIMLTEGTPDASGKVITSTTTVDDFATRTTAQVRTVTTIVDADHHKSEMWQPGPDGVPFKSLEVVYTRRK